MAVRGKILIIEDDPVACDFLSQFFQEKECDVTLAGNGKEGIDKMAEGPFDIIFLDLNMPVMSGLEALPHLRDRDQKAHIVITTAFASYESKLESREHGVRDYLVKPVTLAKIQEITEKYLPKPTEPQDITEDGLASVELDVTRLDARVARLIPEHIARMFFLVAVAENRNVLTVAMTDPGNHEVIDRIKKETGYAVLTLQAARKDILEALSYAYADNAPVGEPPDRQAVPAAAPPPTLPKPAVAVSLPPTGSPSPQPSAARPSAPATAPRPPTVTEASSGTLNRLAVILSRAVERQAQEIHLDPTAGKIQVRLRVHGRLESFMEISPQEYTGLTQAIQAPHGRVNSRAHARDRVYFQNGAQTFQYTYHILPTLYGDSILIYLHDQNLQAPDIWNVDMDPQTHSKLVEALKRRHGMIYLTGLPGHGHMTTCYAALQYVQTTDSKIITLEHSVGPPVSGLTQAPLRSEIGQTYAAALREVLLHHPDVIALEETPDRETANLALHASAAGRLALSTMYAADSAACLTALLQMGLSPLLVSRTLTLILAQYRLRRICSNCKTPTPPSDIVLKGLSGIDPSVIPGVWFFGAGCEQCGMTGFHGQVMIYEALPVTPDLQQSILEEATEHTLRQNAVLTGYIPLLNAGFEKVAEGLTTMDELLHTVPIPHRV